MKFRQAFTLAILIWVMSVLLNSLWAVKGVEAAATTDPIELEALKAIAQHWSIGAWNFSEEDPCRGNLKWTLPHSNPGIYCDCSENNTCHVTQMKVYAVDVSGSIPKELFKLTYLWDLNLGQNILSGSIPIEFGQLTRMQYLSLGINNLSGPVPQELGKLVDLISLSFSSNKLTGPLPKELGNLKSLEQLYIDSSGVSGIIPPELGNLKSLHTLWASDNLFTGKLPEFIGTLTNLNTLYIQGTSLEGPIPQSFSALTKLTSLKIGDLISGESSLSFLRNIKNLTILSLRNCQISGQIPEVIGELSNLLYLDLSFNKLTGPIPNSFQNLQSLQFLFLGSNNLTGQLPSQLINSKLIALDLSFNHFSGVLPISADKGDLAINLVGTSLAANSLNDRQVLTTLNCFQENFPCNKEHPNYSSFSVNCGGIEKTSATGVVFEDDSEVLLAASFYEASEQKWAVSNTGNFMSSPDGPKYTVTTSSQIIGTLDSELYQTARISPSSLKYYGIGLENGKYNVEIHFAEIVMEDNLSWKSLGRRIFDVYIQGERTLQDFNIQDEARSSNKAVVKTFKVNVTKNMLEIHLFWAGKGTCCIPLQGTYGPLVSAIHVSSDSIASSSASKRKNKNHVGKIIGIVVGAAAGALVLGSLIYLGWMKKDRELMQVNTDSPGRNEFYTSAVKP